MKVSTILSIFSFIVGFLSCTNILNLFYVGSTPIHVSYPVTLLIIIVTLALRGNVVGFGHYITTDLKLFAVSVFLSVFSVLLFNPAYLYQWGVGTIGLFLNLIIIFYVLEAREYINFIWHGLLSGIILNMIVSVYAYTLYLNGISFDITQYIPNTFGVAKIYLTNSFSARGLFREQGHLMRFLAIYAIPLIVQLGKTRSAVILALALGVMMISTGSSSTAIFICGLLWFVFCLYRHHLSKIIAIVFLSIFIVLLVLVFVSFSDDGISFLSKVTKGVTSITDFENNSGRINGMFDAFRLIGDYFGIGCGWGTYTQVYKHSAYYGDAYVYGTYSALLQTVAELGVFASFIILFFLSKGLHMSLYGRDTYTIALGSSLLIFFMEYCLTDYSIQADNTLLLALVLIQYRNMQFEKSRKVSCLQFTEENIQSRNIHR